MLLFVVNKHRIKQYGVKYFISHLDIFPHYLFLESDYVIKFEGQKMSYLKNRSGEPSPFTEKEISFMLLGSKDISLAGF